MTGRDFYTWQTAAFTARLSYDVIDRLNRNLSDSRLNPNEEMGGILYGFIRDGVPEITKFEFFRSEHRRGVSYDLGASERVRLGRYVASGWKRRAGPKPIGYFRTHLRPGLFLDQDDFAVMSGSFADPAAVALLIRTDRGGKRTAGFFHWLDGDMDRRQTAMAFPFEISSEWLAARATEKSQRKPFRIPVPSPRWAAAALAVPALAAAVVVLRHQPARRPLQSTVPQIIVAPQPTGSVAGRQPSAEQSASAETFPEEAPPPVFDEDDDGDENPEQAPAPVKSPVQIARTIAPPAPAPAPAPKATVEPIPAAVPAPAPEPAVAKPVPPPREPVVLVAVSVEAPPQASDDGSGIRRAVGKVPVLGHPFRRKPREFTPAKAERGLTPRVPRRLAEDLAQEVTVDVRVSLDPSGVVRGTEILSGGRSGLALLAADTARSASWQPAELGDRNVPSEVIVHYRFRPGEQ